MQNQSLIKVIVIAAVAAVVLAGLGGLPLSFMPTTYQGPKPSFAAVYYNNQWYTQGDCHGGSLCRFDTSLAFDPDGPSDGMGNLEGEMTSIFVPSSSNLLSVPDWVPKEWVNGLQYMKNPIRTYEWRVNDSNGRIHQYVMEEWVLKWFVSIEYGGDSNAEYYTLGVFSLNPVRYHNTEVWFKISMNNMWYFNNATNVYFGIAKVILTNIKVTSMDPSSVDVYPESTNSILALYTNLPIEGGQKFEGEKQILRYKGAILNPEVFRKEAYVHISLFNFGANVNGLAIPPKVQGDIITYGFDVHTFVVGEWIVKDIQQLPEHYNRTPNPLGGWLTDTVNNLVHNVLTNPFTWFLTLLAGLIIIAVFAPEVFLVLFEVLRGVRRK